MKLLLPLILLYLMAGCNRPVTPDRQTDTLPVIFPDYSDVTFPSNICPPNFYIREEGSAYQTEIGSEEQQLLIHRSSSPEVRIPAKKWKAFLANVQGGTFHIRISVKRDGKWVQYRDIINTASPDTIDLCLVYRKIYPGYELWNKMGIYQRDLTSFRETPLIENNQIRNGCINCHNFSAGSPDRMMLHVRSEAGGTVIIDHGKARKINTQMEGMKNGGSYPAWHPTGKYIAFAANEIKQFFHATGSKPVEVSDLAADLIFYDMEKDALFTDSLVAGKNFLETFPNWSPDGNYLYYCRAEALRKQSTLDNIRYDLYRTAFDRETRRFGVPEYLYAATAEGKSVSFPRVSPDGRHLMFTRSDYGNFSIWHAESDLCLLDLSSGNIRCMDEVNSADVESFHSWSANNRWFVFSSKRIDGLWACPHIAPFDPVTGKAGKAFPLPQEDPRYYDLFTQSFNIPELITAPVGDVKLLQQAARRPVH